jgi:hypothetical protein
MLADGLMLITGSVFTLTCFVAELAQPYTSVPVTV